MMATIGHTAALAKEWILRHEEAINKDGWTSVQVDQLAAVATQMLALEEALEEAALALEDAGKPMAASECRAAIAKAHSE